MYKFININIKNINNYKKILEYCVINTNISNKCIFNKIIHYYNGNTGVFKFNNNIVKLIYNNDNNGNNNNENNNEKDNLKISNFYFYSKNENIINDLNIFLNKINDYNQQYYYFYDKHNDDYCRIPSIIIENEIYFSISFFNEYYNYSKNYIYNYYKKDIKIYMETKNNKDIYYTNKEGLINISSRLRKVVNKHIILDEININNDKLKICKELNTIEKIINYIYEKHKITNYKLQYNYKNYKIDLVINNNIAIEIDENNHKKYNITKEKIREDIIKERFILLRFNPDNINIDYTTNLNLFFNKLELLLV